MVDVTVTSYQEKTTVVKGIFDIYKLIYELMNLWALIRAKQMSRALAYVLRIHQKWYVLFVYTLYNYNVWQQNMAIHKQELCCLPTIRDVGITRNSL